MKKYEHFFGHYGTAWQNQGKEFAEFPGAILMTTNCIQRPKGDTAEKLFTTGRVGWPGLPHIDGEDQKDFSPVIEKALALQGFAQDEDKGSVMTGFARNAVLGVADKVIEAVKGGAIRALLPGGRLRRSQARPLLLYRVCGKDPGGHRGADPCLRQVPLL